MIRSRIKCTKVLLNNMENSYREIIKNYEYINSLGSNNNDIIHSCQWLLDNIYLIEKEYKMVKANLPLKYCAYLPLNTEKDLCVPRIYTLAQGFIKTYEGIVKKDNARKYITTLKEEYDFTMGELWAFPLMLRVVLLEYLSEITDEMSFIVKEKKKANLFCEKIINAYVKSDYTETFNNYISENKRATIPFIERTIKVLRDNALEKDEVIKWLALSLPKGNGSIDNAIKEQYVNEGKLQRIMGNSITSLRSIDAIDWKTFFESISDVEEILSKDPCGIYKKMDFETRDNYRHNIEVISKNSGMSEKNIAMEVLSLANNAMSSHEEFYKQHVGYYILDLGKNDLKKKLKYKPKGFQGVKEGIKKNPYMYYFGLMSLFIIFLEAIVITSYFRTLGYISINKLILGIIVSIIPISEVVIAILNWSVTNIITPSQIPKLKMEKGLTQDISTIVVIPALINNVERLKSLIDDMEVYYLANREENLYFAILGDFKDANSENEAEDEKIVKEALKEVKELNNKYCKKGNEIFFFFNRQRKFNESMGYYLGWERKRGKLVEFMKLIRGSKRTSFNVISSDISKLRKVKYLITLDADTKLPRDSVRKLVGAMSHPLNNPILDNNNEIVIRGYGIMQPRIAVSILASEKTNFSRIFSGETGMDVYTTAISDAYQDIFGEGIFTGKGIIDIDTFYKVLKNEIPENSVLSHDLLEGCYARAALVTDINLVDGYPSHYKSSSLRLHRWVRGDWQLVPWLKSKKISKLSKWKIVDNLRRSLLTPSVVLLILLQFSLLSGGQQWLALAFLSIGIPILFDVSEVVVTPKKGIGLNGTLSGSKMVWQQIFFIFSFIPHQAFLMLDAIFRTLYRTFISKKNMLQWQTAADTEATAGKTLTCYIKSMYIASIIALVVAALAFNYSLSLGWLMTPICAIWFISPLSAYIIGLRLPKEKEDISKKDEVFIREISRRTWCYYEDFVNKENNYLAPDNYQEDPEKGIAYRTSPTNVAMGLITNITAYDIGFIGINSVLERLNKGIESINRLEKYHGHLYNWYDTKSMKPLWPRYISTVDSGNLVGYYWVIIESLKEYKSNPIIREVYIKGLVEALSLAEAEDKNRVIYKELIKEISKKNYDIYGYNELLHRIWSIAINYEKENKDGEFYWNSKVKYDVSTRIKEIQILFPWLELSMINVKDSELTNALNECIFKVPIKELPVKLNAILVSLSDNVNINKEFLKLLSDSINNILKLLRISDSLNNKLEKLSEDTDFNILYNNEVKLFSIGYDVENDSLGSSYYDLMASEARAASFIAIAKGDVSTEHWFKLGRAMASLYGRKSLVSWSGTMFEYFMPLLIMKSYPKTLLNQTYYSVLHIQKKYSKVKKIPWGISESAFYHFDVALNYQYKAFGVPEVGLKRGLGDELVVSPYSVALALMVNSKDAIKAMKNFVDMGMLGRYGFYESIDYTKDRIPKGKSYAIVKNYMVHHQGMILMAFNNVLFQDILSERFHRLAEVKATEELLQEKVPKVVIYDRKSEIQIPKSDIEEQNIFIREYVTPHSEVPEVQILSNGSYSLMITNSGSGYSKIDNMNLYRWREDVTLDSSGMFFFIKNINSNEYWSAAYEPCKNSGDKYQVNFSLDKAVFKRNDGNIETKTEIVVSPDFNAEIRKITLTNHSNFSRDLEITSYMEIILTHYNADLVHPAFSNLFITTDFDAEYKCLLASRRPRAKSQHKPYAVHFILEDVEKCENIQYETSRANFIGRNRDISNPMVMDNETPLENKVGIVLDPIFSLRKRVNIMPGENVTISFVTACTSSREEALNVVKHFRGYNYLERVFEEAMHEVQWELKGLGIKSAQANFYQRVANNIIFPSNFKYRDKYIKNINKYQRDLWPYGISGDLPMLLVVVEEEKDLDMIRQVLLMYKYWQLKGLVVDLIIYNKQDTSYTQPLQNSIAQLVNVSEQNKKRNYKGSIYIHSKSTISEEILNFLKGISKVVVESSKGSLIEQLDNSIDDSKFKDILEVNNNLDSKKIVSYIRHKELQGNKLVSEYKIKYKDKSIKDKNVESFYKNLKYNYELGEEIAYSNVSKLSKEKANKDLNYPVDKLLYYNGYGGFHSKSNSYIIVLNEGKNTPAPWINVISNRNFGFHISESGSSYSWCGNSRENKITPWNNDAVSDISGEVMYVRDEDTGEFWTLTPKPVREDNNYIIEHGYGYSTFIHNSHGIEGEMTCFAPLDKELKIIKVNLKNSYSYTRNISVFYYAQLVLGVSPQQTSQYISTYIYGDGEFVYGINPYSEAFGKLKAFLKIIGGENNTFTGNRKEFLGRGGHISYPLALKSKALSNMTGAGMDPCLAEQTFISIKPGETKEISIILGEIENLQQISTLINSYNNKEVVYQELTKVKDYWSNLLGTIKVKTPDKSMDILLNGWLVYQNLSCRYWARSAFYQSGGAYGFRDQLQDSLALGILDPNFTKNQILKSAARQFIEGDVQHWWHPVVNSGIRTRFSDDLLWLPYVTAEYINFTGDYSILYEEAPYLKDKTLEEGEDERYNIVAESNEKGTVYEHCIKAIKRALKFGEHNIPLMGSGDWNDGMSTVGNKGKGESIWLGWFLYDILNKFQPICYFVKDNNVAAEFKDSMNFIRENIEKYGWDGGWYRRAYFDNGTPLGSMENSECKIDSLAQSWAAISGAGKISRVKQAMEAVEKYLVKEDKEIILLLAPPFDNSQLEPGYIKGYVPGVRENGGQYTHAAVWCIMAYTLLRENNKAWKYFNMINPINHSSTSLEAKTYKVEPYVMAADVYLKEPFSGRGGWSWYTGAAGWMYKVGVQNILGFKIVQGKGFIIEPCVPDHWNEYEIEYTRDNVKYYIKVIRDNKDLLTMDGETLKEKLIPFKPQGEHYVEVRFQ